MTPIIPAFLRDVKNLNVIMEYFESILENLRCIF